MLKEISPDGRNNNVRVTVGNKKFVLSAITHTDSRVLWNTTSGNNSWVWASRQLPSAR